MLANPSFALNLSKPKIFLPRLLETSADFKSPCKSIIMSNCPFFWRKIPKLFRNFLSFKGRATTSSTPAKSLVICSNLASQNHDICAFAMCLRIN